MCLAAVAAQEDCVLTEELSPFSGKDIYCRLYSQVVIWLHRHHF